MCTQIINGQENKNIWHKFCILASAIMVSELMNDDFVCIWKLFWVALHFLIDLEKSITIVDLLKKLFHFVSIKKLVLFFIAFYHPKRMRGVLVKIAMFTHLHANKNIDIDSIGIYCITFITSATEFV